MKSSTERAVRRMVLTALVWSLSGACGGEAESGEGMRDMPGMLPAAGEPSTGAVPMEVHLARMAGLPVDSLVVVLPVHRQMVANMLARMNREMAGMNMTSDAAWNATVDSIRSDLTAMPTMGSATLGDVMPAHIGRVQRLMTMHAAMMGPL